MSRIRSIGTRAITGLAFGAAAAALASPAFASVTTVNHGTLNSSPQPYAIQAVTGAGGALTLSANINYLSLPPTSTGSFLITFALPTGVTFASTPSAAGDGAVCASSVPVSSGGNGSSSVTFTATVNAITGACRVTLSAFLVSGATALQQPTTLTANSLNSAGFNISEQVTGSNVGGVANEATATPIALAYSESELVFNSTNQTAAPVAIDVSSPSLGTKFSNGGTDQVLADIGALNYGTNGAFNATASGPYNFPGSTLSITLSGNFSGIGSAYLDTGNSTGSCAPDATTEAGRTGVVAGTVAANSITFAGVNGGGVNNPFLPANNGTQVPQAVCLYATGTQLLGANPNGFGATASISPTTAQADSVSPSALESIRYNGVVQQLLYATDGPSYPGYVRIVNNSANTVPVFASVQTDSGSVGTATVESGLAGNHNDLVPVSTIAGNAGVTPSSRMTLTLFAPGTSSCVPGLGSFGQCSVGFSLVLLNPSGDVTLMGSGGAP
jgi:hypothetical protein